MKRLTYEIIKSFDPCYDPIKYISTDWSGTAVDILRMENIPFSDRLWCVLRTDVTSERVMRLFAVWSYRQTLAFIKDPDPRSVEAANVAERFANNEASQEELSAARSACSAAWSAAESAARSAAWSAAESAESAARSAAWSAAWSAESAARSACSAACSAAESAAWSAESAARSAARSAAWSAQRDKLIEMIETENKGA